MLCWPGMLQGILCRVCLGIGRCKCSTGPCLEEMACLPLAASDHLSGKSRKWKVILSEHSSLKLGSRCRTFLARIIIFLGNNGRSHCAAIDFQNDLRLDLRHNVLRKQ